MLTAVKFEFLFFLALSGTYVIKKKLTLTFFVTVTELNFVFVIFYIGRDKTVEIAFIRCVVH